MKEVYSKEELTNLRPNKYKRLLGVDFATVILVWTNIMKIVKYLIKT